MSHYENYYIREQRLWARHELYYRYPENYYVHPFPIAGNIWYVGDQKVCSHLIDTGDGLILIDTGYPHTSHLYLNAIWEAGFRPADVKIILHTHAHFDHFGSTVTLQKLYGAKAYVSRVDWERISEQPELLMLPNWPNIDAKIFHPDTLLEDGDVVSLGNTRIRCVATPGHTEGTLSFFFDTEDGGRVLHVGTFGGAGFITLYKEFFARYGLPVTLQQDFLASIEKLKSEPVDLVLGNHPDPNHIMEKMQEKLAHPDGANPFIDKDDWKRYLEWVETEFRQFLSDGN